MPNMYGIIFFRTIEEATKIQIHQGMFGNEVLDFETSDTEPSPTVSDDIPTNFISGMVKVDGKLLILFDIENGLTIY